MTCYFTHEIMIRHVFNENSVSSANIILLLVRLRLLTETFRLWKPKKNLPSIISFRNRFVKKKNQFLINTRNLNPIIIKVSFPVKTAIDRDRLDWLKNIDNNWRTQPKHVCKYISKFKGNDHSVTQSSYSRDMLLISLQTAFLYFNPSSVVHPPDNPDCLSPDFLNVPRISVSDPGQAVCLLCSRKCVGPD
jgi:hypothetical protein